MPFEIINTARSNARVSLIGALSDNNQDTIFSVAEYRKALRWLVEETEWNCLTTSCCPEQITDFECCDIPPEFKYAFMMPPLALRLASVCVKSCDDTKGKQSDDTVVRNRIIRMKGKHSARKAIVTDCTPIIIEYISLPDDCEVENFSQNMRDALTYRLTHVFMEQNGDTQNGERYRQLAEMTLRRARQNDTEQGDAGDEIGEVGFLHDARCW